MAARLKALCPNGVDVFFANVGGEILDAALARLAMREGKLKDRVDLQEGFDQVPGACRRSSTGGPSSR